MPRSSRSRSAAGFGLVEVLVAVVVLAVGVVALQRLVVRSVTTVREETERTRALLAAQALVADAAAVAPPPGHLDGTTPDGLRFARDVVPMPHPRLAEVRVAVWAADGAPPLALVEVVDATAR
jgi:prepilin-type N-terminal cleavage/methylation domain-containing protein